MKWIYLLAVIISTTVGDIFRSLGMKHHGEIHDFRPGALGEALSVIVRNWMVIISTIAMAFSFFAFMKLVAVAPVSFAVPMSAASLVPETVLAKILLKETVDWQRWAGVGLIAVGVFFISQ